MLDEGSVGCDGESPEPVELVGQVPGVVAFLWQAAEPPLLLVVRYWKDTRVFMSLSIM